jgi:ribose/xylose/arabinose/galactoside ABC-type transport system permease subunit
MASKAFKNSASRFLSDYGMLLVLLVLGVFFSYVTWTEQHPTGAGGGKQLVGDLARTQEPGKRVLIVARASDEDRAFAEALRTGLTKAGLNVTDVVTGQPADARRAIERIAEEGGGLDIIACNQVTATWTVVERAVEKFPAGADIEVATPSSYWWPNFLKADNLLNIANQIVVIAIVAVGMTMVIITAGIDLSVGSLIALSAVVSTLLIRDAAGAEGASVFGMVACCIAAVVVCAAVGSFSGLMIALFDIPPFIATLGMMLVASGMAYILAEGQSIYEIPASFIWLGRGTTMHMPNAVLLMGFLYVAAHIVMKHTAFGRHIYTLGGNIEAARLSGVRVRRVLLLVYTISGAAAGLGGVVLASQLRSGAPNYGLMYELYVIAAVVVGGTSLRGGEGRIFGTLIGAFIIAVIQNGMNLTGVESYTQKVVLGLVILGAVLLDVLKTRGWNLLKGATA